MSVRQKLKAAASDGQIDQSDHFKARKNGPEDSEGELDDDFKATTLPRHVKINRESSSTQVQVRGEEHGKRQKSNKKGRLRPMTRFMKKCFDQYILGKKPQPKLAYYNTAENPSKTSSALPKQQHQYEKNKGYTKVPSYKPGVENGESVETENLNTELSTTNTTSPQHSPKLNGDDRSLPATPALCGLRNLGNTCFMNAIVQCLCNTDSLAEYFVTDAYKTDLNNKHNKKNSRKFGSKGEVTDQLAVVLQAIWTSQYGAGLSRDFKSVVSKYGSQYKGSNQHDAQEFLMWLLDKVHEDLNCATKKKYKPRKSTSNKSDEVLAAEAQANYMRYNHSFVYDLFQAQYKSSLKCPHCQRQRNTFEPYLCLSLPLPQKNLRLLKVIAVYGSQIPNMVQIGVSLDAMANVADLRQAIAKRCGIPVTQLVLTEVYIDGFQRSFRDDQKLSEIHDGDTVYAIETPHSPEGPNICVKPSLPGVHCNGPIEETVCLVLLNKDRAGVQGKRFGRPTAVEASRNLNYMQLQKVILKCLGVRQPDAALIQGPVFKLVVVNREGSKSTISPDEGRPLCTELVERMMSVSSEEGGPIHVKMLLEWEVDIRDCLSPTILSDQIVEDESVKQERDALEEPVNGSLADCFKLYTQEEELSGDDAWHCPYCKRQQHGTRKKLGLWSLPDVLILHLKRFKQTSTKRTKLLNVIDFPVGLLDMSIYLEKKNQQATPSTLNSLTSWSPWKRNRRRPSNPDFENVFELYAVCNHIGNNLGGGHYTATCKNPVDNQWYTYDDTKVVGIPEDKIVTPSAYILFYQRSNLCQSAASSASSTTSSSASDHWVNKVTHISIPNSSSSLDDLTSTDGQGQGQSQAQGQDQTHSQLPNSHASGIHSENGGFSDKRKPFHRSFYSQSLRLPTKRHHRTPLASEENLSDGEPDMNGPQSRKTDTELRLPDSRLVESMKPDFKITESSVKSGRETSRQPVSKATASPAVSKATASPSVYKATAPLTVKLPAESSVVSKATSSPAVSKATPSPAGSKKTTSRTTNFPPPASQAVSVPKSSTSLTVKLPPESPAVSKATVSQTVSKTNVQPAVSMMATVPTVSKANVSPAISKATVPPAVSKATASPMVSKATVSPPVSMANALPVVYNASSSPVVYKSTASPVVSIATASPTVSKAAASQVPFKWTSSPVVSRVTVPPAVSTATASPTISNSTAPPAVHRSTSSPVVSKTTASEGVSKSTTVSRGTWITESHL
ncbi:ubiquitin carboxyl-terminal hydrolase 43-like [Glandiceps talaboti]